jgi:hypothetical protein
VVTVECLLSLNNFSELYGLSLFVLAAITLSMFSFHE